MQTLTQGPTDADSAYLAHHFTCRPCIAAGRDPMYGQRCALGADLWAAYCAAPQETPQETEAL